MVLTAVQVEEGQSVRWRVQNSWGESAGEKGFFVMADKWMDEYVYQVVVDPSFVSKEIRDILQSKPRVLPLWYVGPRPLPDTVSKFSEIGIQWVLLHRGAAGSHRCCARSAIPRRKMNLAIDPFFGFKPVGGQWLHQCAMTGEQ